MGKGHSWSRFTAENLILGLASLAFLITVSGSILYSLELSKKFDHLDEDDIVFVIPVGASFNLIKEILLESGVLKSSLFFSSASYLGKVTDRMQAGEYEVNAESSIRVLVRNLAVGNVRSLTVTLIEGWTFKKALSAIRSSEAIITSSVDFSASGLGIGVTDYPTSTEGMLFPDTYQYSAGTTDYEIISRANARLKDVLSSEWDKKTNNIPWKTPYDALIIASIIEKESGLINEKAEIAGVFARRIEKGMRLQSDPTVIYGLGDEYDGSLTRADLRHDTEFNSYTRSGLPPSPISLAGRESIRAALKPLSGESLYFVADGLGGHVFTNTLNDHNREVKKFREMSAQ